MNSYSSCLSLLSRLDWGEYLLMLLNCAGKTLDLSKPRVMGVLNVTPDSFSDGGQYYSLTKAHERAQQMAAEGAAIIDVGGESTRPGATPVSLQEELDRVIPIIEKLTVELDVPVSVDTSRPEVMREAIAAGVGFVNDIRALQAPAALVELAKHDKIPVCIMHALGEPATMQQAPVYQDVVSEVKAFLQQRITSCCAAGINLQRIVIDPGFGFGKNLEHNLQLLRHLEQFTTLDVPMLVGLSRKAMIGHVLGLSVNERLYASLALAVLAVSKGARLVRAHDVKATVQAITMASAV